MVKTRVYKTFKNKYETENYLNTHLNTQQHTSHKIKKIIFGIINMQNHVTSKTPVNSKSVKQKTISTQTYQNQKDHC